MIDRSFQFNIGVLFKNDRIVTQTSISSSIGTFNMALLFRPLNAISRRSAGSLLLTLTRQQHAYVAGEPAGPSLVTEIPGPVSKKHLAELNALQSMGSVQVGTKLFCWTQHLFSK